MINRTTKICTIVCSFGTALIVGAAIFTILRDIHMLPLGAAFISSLVALGTYTVAKAAISGV